MDFLKDFPFKIQLLHFSSGPDIKSSAAPHDKHFLPGQDFGGGGGVTLWLLIKLAVLDD